jgi:hypothetical protein
MADHISKIGMYTPIELEVQFRLISPGGAGEGFR